MIPLTDCHCFHERHEDTVMQYIHENKTSKDFSGALSCDEQINMNAWSCDEVKVFCAAIKK